MPSVVTYSAAESGLLVNSYLVDTGDGIAVVDTGLLRSDARALRARLDALRAPLRAVLLTHPHPDATRFAPDAPLSWLVGLGADAVARELAA
jgi:glyoxylase-like metal-dependent hydrolase (beta-lactamase superfamily II)